MATPSLIPALKFGYKVLDITLIVSRLGAPSADMASDFNVSKRNSER